MNLADLNPFASAAKAAVEGLGSAVKQAVSAFKADPTKVAELEQAVNLAVIDAGNRAEEAATRALETVNATMRAEAASEHWLQWSWRPVGAYVFYTMVVNNFVIYPYLARFGVVHMEMSEMLFATFAALLGISAFTRGRAKEGNNGGTK